MLVLKMYTLYIHSGLINKKDQLNIAKNYSFVNVFVYIQYTIQKKILELLDLITKKNHLRVIFLTINNNINAWMIKVMGIIFI